MNWTWKKPSKLQWKWTVARKLYGTFGAILLILGYLSLYTMGKMNDVENNSKQMTDKWLMGIEQINQISAMTDRMSSLYFQMQVTPDAAKHDELGKALQQSVGNMAKSVATYGKLVQGDQEKALYGGLTDSLDKFLKLNAAIKAASTPDEAASLTAQLGPVAGALTDALGKLVHYNHDGALAERDQSESIFNRSINFSFFGFLITTLLSILALYLIVRNISVPVRRASEALTRMADGDMTVEEIHVRNQDEIGALIASFNRMQTNLRQSFLQIQEVSYLLADSSRHLFATTEESNSATQHIADSIQGVASISEVQTQNAQDCSRAMDEMASGVQRIAESAQEVSDLSLEASRQAQNGGGAMQNVNVKMKSLHDAVDDAHTVIEKLQQHSRDIGAISTLIGEIATQTNLLSLNAAIEAARAGESGRGFAVVAGEVRKLAGQTEESVDSIRQLITSIQKDTASAVHSMDAGRIEVRASLEAVEVATSTFEQIVVSSSEVSARMQEAAAAVEQIAASTEEVAATVANMGDAARKTSDSAVTVAGTTEEQLASTEDIAASARTLSGIATDLQVLVKKFRLS